MWSYLQKIRETNPLAHCITNIVVANLQANGLLALGASPTMADSLEEMDDIAQAAAVTVLNIGTLNPLTVDAMKRAGKRAREVGNPLVLDPVGAGATTFRKETTLELLRDLDITLIRGNAGELAAIAGIPWEAKGVDAGTGDASVVEIAETVAQDYHCLVALSGEVDVLTDGSTTYCIEGGDEMMTLVTGSGCLLSAVTGAFLAVAPNEPMEAVAEALAFYKHVGYETAQLADAPGSFQRTFLDLLYKETTYETSTIRKGTDQ